MENNNYFKCVLKGTVGTLLFTFSGIVVLSFLMTKLVFSKHMFNVLYLVISLISLAIGAMIAAKKKQSKGLLVGFGVTVFYSVIIYIVCLIINGGFSFNMFELFKLVAALIVGGLGGVLGVNMQE
ncbi:MAG: TIGR04086 family membrane protein [Clostridium butyricum]|uniref:TIGR04086 family membrane protein n=1 Tax=Clostridium butyricum TaxID=1492 RepID=UPI0012B85CBE|nr:TIGR04086 family membrane protein [Clostridium butyricum]MCQ2013691.1 TIGR04086 family membrane protein [Clostridium butyricum]MCQ2025879.1 TIGR04086 family membrane protein [Clostridium butyricum]MZI79764.1 TIGR04086 family membrane protein [Clostridium butyricum]